MHGNNFHKTMCNVSYILPVTQVQAASVKMSKDKVTLNIGKSLTLNVENTTKTATWSCSDSKVAKVSKAGKVTAVKAGTAVITAKISGKAYTCTVTVKAAAGKSLVKDTDEMVILTADKKGTNSYGGVVSYGGLWGDTNTSIDDNPVVKKGTGWSFDPATLTLTLDNFTGMGIYLKSFDNGITVKLIGDNVISYGSLGSDSAFVGGKKLTFTRDGKLTLKLDKKKYGDKEMCYHTLYSQGEIVLNGSCTIDSTGIWAGIMCNKLTIGENCTVISHAVGDLMQSCGVIARGINVYGIFIAVADKENSNSFTNEEYPNKAIALPDGLQSGAVNTYGAGAVMIKGDSEASTTQASVSDYTTSFPDDRYVKISN